MTHTIALITGIAGQDGAILAEYLLARGYEVHGLLRWDSMETTQRLDGLDITLHYGDIIDQACVAHVIDKIQPQEIYNLAAMSHVAVSFDTSAATLDINAKGSLNIFEAVRILKQNENIKIYQASSSEMFGSAPAPQNEETQMNPCSPYGVSKLSAYHLAKIYRDAHGMFIANGILFNHESPMRGQDFVTQKIAKAVAMIEAGQQEELTLGNLDSLRDWGHARDYVAGMHAMLQYHEADDFVLATGEAHSVRDFVQAAFDEIGVKLQWRGRGMDEVGVDWKTEKVLVRIDPKFFRPKEVDHLLGDASKARFILDWQPKTGFSELVSEMVGAEREKLWTNTSQEQYKTQTKMAS